MSRNRILMLALTAVALTGSSAIGAAGPEDRRLGALDVPTPTVWSPDARTPFERLTAAGADGVTPQAWADLQRDLLALNKDAHVGDPEFVYPGRAGDLDGDGKNEVFTVEFTREEPILHARRGDTGTVLWSLDGAYAVIPGDLDGDGLGDFVTLSAETVAQHQDDFTDETDGEIRNVTITARAQVVSFTLSNGVTLWRHVLPSIIKREGDVEVPGPASDVEAVVALEVMPDATGDGASDIWVGTSTMTQDAEQLFPGKTFTGHVLDGRSGLEVARLSAHAAEGTPLGAPTTDLSGDGLADAVMLSIPAEGNSVLTASTLLGQELWTASVPTRFAYLTVHEMTGDAKTDVVVQAADDSALRHGYSGADGSLLWSQSDYGYIESAGDIDGDGGTDFIRVEGMFGSSNVLSSWSGKTGAPLWDGTAFPAPDGWMTFNCFCADDLTGDGIWDPLLAHLDWNTNAFTLMAVDGNSGLLLWTGAADAAHGFPTPIGADASGDGAPDLAHSYGDGADLNVRTLRGTDYSPIASLSAPYDGHAMYAYGDDITGDGDVEMIVAALRVLEDGFKGSAQALGSSGRIWATH